MLFVINSLSYLQVVEELYELHAKGKKYQDALLQVKTFKKLSTQNAQDVDKSPSTSYSEATSK